MQTTKPNGLSIEPWNGRLLLVLPVSNTRVKKLGVSKSTYLVNNLEEVKDFIKENNKLAIRTFGEGIFEQYNSKLTLTWGEACAVWTYRVDVKYFAENFGDQPDFDMSSLEKA